MFAFVVALWWFGLFNSVDFYFLFVCLYVLFLGWCGAVFVTWYMFCLLLFIWLLARFVVICWCCVLIAEFIMVDSANVGFSRVVGGLGVCGWLVVVVT